MLFAKPVVCRTGSVCEMQGLVLSKLVRESNCVAFSRPSFSYFRRNQGTSSHSYLLRSAIFSFIMPMSLCSGLCNTECSEQS